MRADGGVSDSLEQFERLFMMSPELLCIAGLDGRFRKVNPAFERTLGYSAAELTAVPFVEFVHPDDREATAHQVANLENGIPVMAFENRYRRRDGSYRTLSWTFNAHPEDGVIYGAARDITEQRRRERELRQSEERYRRIVSLAQEGIWTLDADGRVSFLNDRMAEILGRPLHDVMGSHFLELVPAESHLEAQEHFERRREGQQEKLEFSFVRRDGTRIATLVSSRPLFDDEGHFEGVLAMVTDISERKAAEEQLRLNESRLTEIVEAQQELALGRLGTGELLERVAQLALKLTRADGAVVELVQDQELVVRASAGGLVPPRGLRLKVGPNLSVYTLRTGKLLDCSDTETDPRVDTELCRERGVRSLVAAAMRSGGAPVGVVKVLSGRPQAFNERTVQTVQLLAESVGASVSRLRFAEPLQNSERQYRLLFDSNPHAMWVYDPASLQLLAVNAAAVRQYGYTREEFLAMRTFDLEAPGGRHRLRDGGLIEVEVAGDDIIFNDLPARLVLVQDVTEKRASEREVVRMNRALQTLSSCNQALSRATGEETLLLEICRILVELGGYKMAWVGYAEHDPERSIRPAACHGHDASYLAHLRLTWGEGAPGPAAECIRTGRPLVIPSLALEPSVEPWLPQLKQFGYRAMVALPLRYHELTFGFLGLYSPEVRTFPPEEVDLLQELAEGLSLGVGSLRLREQQRRMQEAVLAIARGVSQGGGGEFLDLLGKSLVDAIGADFGLVGVIDPARAELRTLTLWIDGQRVADRTFILQPPCLELLAQPSWVFASGVQQQFPDVAFHVDCQAYVGAPLLDSRGQVVGMLAALFRRPLAEPEFVRSTVQILASRAASELERQQSEMQFLRAQRLESIGTLAGGIAHDLNNVLAPILMGIDLLDDACTQDIHREILDVIRQGAQRGAAMVRQVLSFARGVEVNRTAVDVGRLAGEVWKLVRDTFDRNITVRLQRLPELWPVEGDPTQLHQVLLNLCVNARDAMPAGGELLIAADNLVLDEQFAAAHPRARAGRYVRLSVHDTGEGIPPENLQRIFDPFFTTKEVGQGTGLGLSTVQGIVRSHGGFLEVESSVGKGSSFRLYLPVTDPAPEHDSPSAEEAPPQGTGELILVVDDEAPVRTITRQTLEAHNYTVVEAEDGAAAVAIFALQGREVAAVITDMMMPVMDGTSTIRALQRLRPEVRIIAVSGHGAAPEAAGTRVAALGIRHFLPKPYTAGLLLRTVRQVLDEPDA